MSDWPRSIWAEARQITQLLGWPAMRGDEAPPRRFFAQLRDDGRDREAVRFMAQALPRYEAVLWSYRTVTAHAVSPDPATMAAIADWIATPSDPRRKSACAAAHRAPPASAARLCGLAIHLSGGSLSATDKPPQQPGRDATGRFAAAAVIAAAADTPAFGAVIGQALDLGDHMLATDTE